MDSLLLQKLPNEVLAAIVDLLPVRELLKTAILCRELHLLCVHSLHQRLQDISSLPDHDLILECYHPTAKISTPYLSCRYLGTRHPDDCDADGNEVQISPSDTLTLSQTCQLYASFRPVVTEENRLRRFRLLWPKSVSGPPAGFLSEDEVATQNLHVDEGERFTQLCNVLNIITKSKTVGAFVTHYNMSEHVVRVFRRWLDEMAATMNDGLPWDATNRVPLTSDRILWVDTAKNIGLRFHISLGPAERMPLLSGPGEDPAVSYTLTYEELLIRSTSLLLAVEASRSKELEPSSNSIILSSAAT